MLVNMKNNNAIQLMVILNVESQIYRLKDSDCPSKWNITYNYILMRSILLYTLRDRTF